MESSDASGDDSDGPAWIGPERVLNPLTLYLLGVIFLATLIRSAFGFGEALIAVPLLALRIPVAIAVPLAVLLSITIAAVIVVQDWRHVHFRSATWLVVATIPGIPLGLWLLKAANERVVDSILAAVIISFSAYSLLARRPPRLEGEGRGPMLGFGFAAGVLGGAYGMNGPPLVIYAALRRWSAPHLRATLQAYFLPASLLGLAGYWAGGLLGRNVLLDYLICLPAALIAIPLGRSINRRLHGRAFLLYIHASLILVGLTLLIEAARR